MAIELCPTCKAVKNMRVTVSERKVRGADGKERTVTTRTYHCESCGLFVRSDDGTAAVDDGEAWPRGRTQAGSGVAWRRGGGCAEGC